MEKGCPFGQNLIAPSLRFIQETGGVKRNPKFTMSWQQHQAYSSTLGLGGHVCAKIISPEHWLRSYNTFFIVPLEQHTTIAWRNSSRSKKIISGTLGRVKRLIKRLGDRSSNPLTYGYSSSDSFGYDRDYEPRHVVGIAWGFELCFFDLLWTCPKARLGLHFFASYLGYVSLNFTNFCRACVNLSQSLSDCQESNFSNSCRSCNWGLQLWLRRPKLR